ncbi:heterokaryon incompatibility protein Het-C-domain-containing protein [Amylocarpus encephaloides]|uniref:Heterokaryon incompatibility protein Het-C-domain-containing protein n=1 Tax=Amylocarpus encephaloides TaxID=45428 RepID=A0A9P8C754_9HELO|nr:heterokaryon incompatibility protein Het-C-domain-containing protein [Amylocarpus encephaloides]
MPTFRASTTILTIALILLLAGPAHAFGAGNIGSVSKVEGVNWRHGDIEDTLLTLFMARAAGGKKFSKMMVARVYFGNWLRDYCPSGHRMGECPPMEVETPRGVATRSRSEDMLMTPSPAQAIDVGTVKYVSAEAIRILLWVLGFMTFGFGTKEFEVTTQRLGCYRPEDHIDNPKDYADNIDATQYDRRLRGPVDERVELAIDPETGLKNYIANERAGIMTSALHVRRLFTECVRLGRSYGRTNNKDELYEALRLLGTGLHCLEDYSAHSNYIELALIEMGEEDVFPHVGSDTAIRLRGARGSVYPLVTGTFGGVDFLHSVCGELDDKATQSEIEGLEGTMRSGGNADTSALKDLLNSIPSGIFGDQDPAGKADELQGNATAAQMNQVRVSPREPEEFTQQMQEIQQQIYPIIEWHDEIMHSIQETIENIPILPELLEQVEEQISVFVFSLLAPFVLPIIGQVKNELNTGSSEIIQSSKEKQLIVFHDSESSDPTHSMLSKDHFSNILNEAGGKIASAVLTWVVPQLMACWDDDNVDVDRTLDRIVHGVFHHPALREQGEDGAVDGRRAMFGVVERWWNHMDRREQQDYRRKLTRDGVMNGENHKEGVHDSGHGCAGPLKMHKTGAGGGGGPAGDLLGGIASAALSGGKSGSGGSGGGDTIGGIVGGILGSVLGGDDETTTYGSQGYDSEGNYQQKVTQVSHPGNQYGQTQYSETQYRDGGERTEYQSYEQSGDGGSGYEQRAESHGGYQPTQPQSHGRQSRHDDDHEHDGRDRRDSNEGRRQYGGHSGGDGGGREGYDQQQPQGYAGGGRRGSDERLEGYGGSGGFTQPEFDRREEAYERRDEYGGGGRSGRNEYASGGGRNEYGSGGGRDEYGGGGNESGGRQGRDEPDVVDEVANVISGFLGGNRGDDDTRRGERRQDGGGGWFS